MVVFFGTCYYRLEEVRDGVHGSKWEALSIEGHAFLPPQAMSAHRMEVDLIHGYIPWAMELHISKTGKWKQQHPYILALQEKHLVVFGDIPLGRPPDRGFKHTIELEEGVHVVITTPYKHPKAYQDEIKRDIQELLALRHIRPSSSPFTSSAVLVKKKDGMLHMHIYYTALKKKD